jgi:DNA-binding XRE family transcriptional regulator
VPLRWWNSEKGKPPRELAEAEPHTYAVFGAWCLYGGALTGPSFSTAVKLGAPRAWEVLGCALRDRRRARPDLTAGGGRARAAARLWALLPRRKVSVLSGPECAKVPRCNDPSKGGLKAETQPRGNKGSPRGYPTPGLRTARYNAFLTQEELGAKSGVSRPTIAHLEIGAQRGRISTIRKLAKAMKVDPQVLLAEPEEEVGQ